MLQCRTKKTLNLPLAQQKLWFTGYFKQNLDREEKLLPASHDKDPNGDGSYYSLKHFCLLSLRLRVVLVLLSL